MNVFRQLPLISTCAGLGVRGLSYWPYKRPLLMIRSQPELHRLLSSVAYRMHVACQDIKIIKMRRSGVPK